MRVLHKDQSFNCHKLCLCNVGRIFIFMDAAHQIFTVVHRVLPLVFPFPFPLALPFGLLGALDAGAEWAAFWPASWTVMVPRLQSIVTLCGGITRHGIRCSAPFGDSWRISFASCPHSSQIRLPRNHARPWRPPTGLLRESERTGKDLTTACGVGATCSSASCTWIVRCSLTLENCSSDRGS